MGSVGTKVFRVKDNWAELSDQPRPNCVKECTYLLLHLPEVQHLEVLAPVDKVKSAPPEVSAQLEERCENQQHKPVQET